MHTVALHGQALPAVYDGNLNGIFDFLGRQVGNLCRAAGRFISGKVSMLSLGLINGKFIENYFNALADKADKAIGVVNPNARTAAGSDISAAEAENIKNFLETKLQPFVGSLLDELKQVTLITNQASKLVALNAILNKINTVNDYYDVETESKTTLSENARQQRQYLIYEMLRTVNDGVEAAAAQMGITTTIEVTFSPGVYNFSPLFSGQPLAQVTGENYKVNGTTTTVATLPTANPTKTPTVVKGITLSNSTTLGNITKTTTGTTTTTTSAGTTPAAKKSNIVPIAIGIGVLVGGYMLLKGKDDKKKARPATKAKKKVKP